MAWSEKPKPNPADYAIVVHVRASSLVAMCHESLGHVRCGMKQRLNVVINGKKFELSSAANGKIFEFDTIEDSELVLRIGDYKAKELEYAPPEASQYHQAYEFLLPDGITRRYAVVGESE